MVGIAWACEEHGGKRSKARGRHTPPVVWRGIPILSAAGSIFVPFRCHTSRHDARRLNGATPPARAPTAGFLKKEKQRWTSSRRARSGNEPARVRVLAAIASRYLLSEPSLCTLPLGRNPILRQPRLKARNSSMPRSA